MYSEDEINLIILSSFSDLSYGVKNFMLNGLTSFTPDFAKCDNTLIKTLPHGVYNKVKGKFFSPSYRAQVLNNLERKGITCVTFASGNYPEPLKHIPEPPLTLYCKGDLKLLGTNCFSIVGSRKSSKRTCAECKKISSEISAAFTVVSGIADGADCAALEGALESGKVISVLANGFDHIYPVTNADIVKKVGKRGLLVTEYSPEVKAKPYFFPFRNRIIAGLSRGTLVVSAGAKSGALITADYALEYGRDVFAFPHFPGSAEGAGCNSLIKNGAALVENILDIFQVYGLDFKSSEKKPLTEREREVYKVIADMGEAFIPAIAEMLQTQPYQLIAVLSSLELKGYIVSLGGNRYAAV